jgi:hypothetical protein
MESEIQQAIGDYLTYRKVFFFRSNNIPPTYCDKAGNRQFRALPKYTMKGIPDIIAVRDGGQFIGIEVKGPKGKPSDDQLTLERVSCLPAVCTLWRTVSMMCRRPD